MTLSESDLQHLESTTTVQDNPVTQALIAEVRRLQAELAYRRDSDVMVEARADAAHVARLEERERCAKLYEELTHTTGQLTRPKSRAEIAAAIRGLK